MRYEYNKCKNRNECCQGKNRKCKNEKVLWKVKRRKGVQKWEGTFGGKDEEVQKFERLMERKVLKKCTKVRHLERKTDEVKN